MGNAQSRREAREARRKKTIRKWVALNGAGFVLLSGGILAFKLGTGNQANDPLAIPSECATTQRVNVETTAAMAEVLKNIPVSAEDCIVLSVDSNTGTLDTANQIISGKSAPNLWIPDSSTRAELALAGKAQIITKSKSLASTPAVIATGSENRYKTWNDALEDSDKVKMGEPKQDSGAFMSLLNATAESTQDLVSADQLAANIGLRAQTIGVDGPAQSASDLLQSIHDDQEKSAIVTEAEFVRFKAEYPGSSVKAYLPEGKSNMLDFPLYQPTSGSDTNKTVGLAADKIENYLASDAGKQALNDQGLRAADGRELPENSVGEVTKIKAEDPKTIANMWTSYQRQSAPLNALIAVDVSGSMGWELADTNRTRMDITKESIMAGSQLFPPRDSLGLWSFALNIEEDDQGNKYDYKKLVPIRNLGEDVDGKNQRDLLREAGKSLEPNPNSFTGLNDTTMAAFDEIKNNYETGSTNVAVIMTDGENTDSNSISTEDLIKTIQSKQDKDNPVFLLFIGISEDANMESLEYLASQTGGEAHTANSAEDIQKIFQEALSITDNSAEANSVPQQ